MKRFMRWLFPDRYSEVATCKLCESVVSKTRMVSSIYGYFCNQDELDQYWWQRQGVDDSICE